MQEDKNKKERVSTGTVLPDTLNEYKEPSSRIQARIWELDFLRGIALLLMIYFHVLYDMKEIYDYNVNYDSGLNYVIGKTSAILFIFISGASCSLSRNNFRRGLKVLGISLIITLVTWFYNSKFVILFGILHFLAVCMILSVYLVKLNKYILSGIGTLILVLGFWISEINVSLDYFFILGIKSSKFISSDYYPLIPWMGIFIYGIVIGKIAYPVKKSVFHFGIKDNFVSKLGRHTLVCYILHQPLILGFLALLSQI